VNTSALIFGGNGKTGLSYRRYLARTLKHDLWNVYDASAQEHPLENFDGEGQWSQEIPTIDILHSYHSIYITPGIDLKKLYPGESLECLNLISDIEIFLQEDASFKIGITGTNGKSTCCYQLSQLLESSQVIGNFGPTVLDHMNSGKKYSIIEISSFQLERINTKILDFGVLLNISPDHIDRHGTFKEYSKIKKRILEAKVSTTENDPFKIFSMITGVHHDQNRILKRLPHRLEEIGPDVNDSKSTNLASLQFAINQMNGSYYLLLCGNPRKEEYLSFQVQGPQKIFIFGKHAETINQKIQHDVECVISPGNLRSLMLNIRDHHPRLPILFSPGHPSGRDYKNFEERGNDFKFLLSEIFDD